MYTADPSRPKSLDFSCKQYIIWVIFGHFDIKNYAWILDIVQKSLWAWSIFLVWHFSSKCPNTPNQNKS